MNRTITVKGRGSVRVAPDRTEVPITLSSRDRDYARVTALADEALAALTAALTAAGFAPEALKTLDLAVNPCYDSVQDEQGRYRQVLTGYECRHSLRLAFPPDNERLARVLEALAACPAQPEFSVRFTVAEPEAVREELLTAAAKDARQKAELLCRAAGVRLGQLVNVQYGVRGGAFYSETNLMLAMGADRAGARKLNVTPEDVSAEDEITFVWEIE